jgi:MFS family permease
MNRIFRHLKSTYTGIPKNAWMLSVVMLINRVGMVVIFYLTLYLTNVHFYTVRDAGILVSIYGLGSLIGSYVGGWLCDYWGTSRVQFLSLAFSGLGYLVIPLMNGYWELALSLFILAIFAEAIRPANITAIAEVCPPEIRPRGYALNRLAVNVGVAIGPAVGGYVARINYHYLFYMDGITSLAAAVLFYIIFFKKPIGKQQIKSEEKGPQPGPLKDPPFVFFLFLLLIIGLFFLQIFNTWPLYLKDHYNLLEDRMGLLLAINALFLVLFEMPIVHRIERKPPLNIIAIGVLFLFFGFAILPLGTLFTFAIFSTLIWTTGEMLIFPLSSTFIANRATEQNRGKYMGLFTFTFSLAFVIGPLAGAWVYDEISPEALWYGMGVAGIFVSIGIKMLARFTKHEKIASLSK